MLTRLELVAFRIVVNMEWELECVVTRPRQLLVLRDELRIIKKKKLTELQKYVIECSDSWHAENGVNLDANYRYTMKRDFSIAANFCR